MQCWLVSSGHRRDRGIVVCRRSQLVGEAQSGVAREDVEVGREAGTIRPSRHDLRHGHIEVGKVLVEGERDISLDFSQVDVLVIAAESSILRLEHFSFSEADFLGCSSLEDSSRSIRFLDTGVRFSDGQFSLLLDHGDIACLLDIDEFLQSDLLGHVDLLLFGDDGQFCSAVCIGDCLAAFDFLAELFGVCFSLDSFLFLDGADSSGDQSLLVEQELFESLFRDGIADGDLGDFDAEVAQRISLPAREAGGFVHDGDSFPDQLGCSFKGTGSGAAGDRSKAGHVDFNLLSNGFEDAVLHLVFEPFLVGVLGTLEELFAGVLGRSQDRDVLRVLDEERVDHVVVAAEFHVQLDHLLRVGRQLEPEGCRDVGDVGISETDSGGIEVASVRIGRWAERDRRDITVVEDGGDERHLEAELRTLDSFELTGHGVLDDASITAVDAVDAAEDEHDCQDRRNAYPGEFEDRSNTHRISFGFSQTSLFDVN